MRISITRRVVALVVVVVAILAGTAPAVHCIELGHRKGN
jgi:hypothetical protein